MSDLALLNQNLPAHLREVEIDETTKALMGGGGGTKRISIEGGVWRMMVNGKEVARNEERVMNVVIVAAAPKVSRTFYAGVYKKGVASAPDCWSADGEVPDAKAKESKIEKITHFRNTNELLPMLAKPDTRKEIALIANVSHGTLDKVKVIKAKASEEIKAKLSTGEVSINQAYQDIKKEEKKEEQKVKKQEYEVRVETVTKNEFKVDIFNTENKFRIIYADPAWSYNDKQDTAQLGGAAKHYDTMSVSEICSLPVKEISEKDSVLFLWVTSPLLEDAFTVIKSWGFKYKTSFVWDKVKHNMGHYNSVRHEFLLIATKGSCVPDNKKLYDSVQIIERNNNHSEKPIEFLNIIDDIYTYGNKLEMFCRNIKKDKWYGWGNEI